MTRCVSTSALLLAVLTICACTIEKDLPDSLFERTAVFQNDVGSSPWVKFTGDLDGDDIPELYVGYRSNGDIVQIRLDESINRPLENDRPVQTDGGIADVDSNGVADVVILTNAGLFVFFGPEYDAMQLSSARMHDIRFVDQDGDGILEIVVRNQTAFGSDTSEIVILSGTRDSAPWTAQTIYEAEGEGLETADLDNDGDKDIVLPGTWLENLRTGDWVDHDFADSWTWLHAKIAVGDVNSDGRIDVVLAPAEPEGESYKIAWYEQGRDASERWVEHVLVEDVESVVHSLQAGDIDLDDDIDIVYAEMHQGEDPDEVVWLENRESQGWRRRLVDTIGSHNLQLFDREGDGDLDMAGANWNGENQEVLVWNNTLCDAPWQSWVRHEIDGKRPGRATFVMSGDLNGDGWPDVVSGSMAYLNPKYETSGWQRISLGDRNVDAAAIRDTDGDGDFDILVAASEPNRRKFELRKNDGKAGFSTMDTGIEMSGDFLQGVSSIETDSRPRFLLSWHEAGMGIELLVGPTAGVGDWSLERISDFSQEEALSNADLDADGDLDIVLGTMWLRYDDGFWSLHAIDSDAPQPDRNIAADVDNDGDIDVVVGFEAISKSGDVVWYENTGESWRRHHVGSVIGPMSVGVTDADQDGDLDIIVGEHNLEDPEAANLWVFENTSGTGFDWRPHRIYIGDEHHDGAHVVDIDLDGDPDVVSIGWGHDDVVWYENRIPACPVHQKPGG
jgi:hypothetical protein